jgi:6-phosphogluconolactonase
MDFMVARPAVRLRWSTGLRLDEVMLSVTRREALVLLAAPALAAAPKKTWLYLGCYTSSGGKGVYVCDFDPASGRAGDPQLAGEMTSPSFVALHPRKPVLYAASEVASFEGQRGGSIWSWSIDPATGKLTLLTRLSSKGGGPCHVAPDPSGAIVMAANYGGGSAVAFSTRADGGLDREIAFFQFKGSSVNPQRQKEPHAHSVNFDRGGRYAIVADLGLDELHIYRVKAKEGVVEPADPPAWKGKPGAGPRHFAFHPGGKLAYVVNEMDSSVTALKWNGAGLFEAIDTWSTLPADFKQNSSCAEIQVHRSGRFVLASNRGHDSIAVFAVEAGSGKLKPLGHTPTEGRVPRNFGFDASGRWLVAANQNTHNLVVFAFDAKSGALKPTGQTLALQAPVCARFWQAG